MLEPVLVLVTGDIDFYISLISYFPSSRPRKTIILP